jgi:hypothetical protein
MWSTLPGQDADGSSDFQIVWATNVPVAGDDTITGWPTETVRRLPAAGIVVFASMAPKVQDGPLLYPDRRLPLRLHDGDFFAGMYENQATPEVSVFRLAAHARDQYITGEVFFGVPDPGSQLLRQAEAQLSRLTLKPSTSEADGDADA